LIRHTVATATAAELAPLGRRSAPGHGLDARVAVTVLDASTVLVALTVLDAATVLAVANTAIAPSPARANSSAAESKALMFHRVLLTLPDRVQAWLQNPWMTAFLRARAPCARPRTGALGASARTAVQTRALASRARETM
jgi:hypothetical protein